MARKFAGILLAMLVGVALSGITACDQSGPADKPAMEKMGEAAEEAADQVGDAAEEAADKVRDAAEEANQ